MDISVQPSKSTQSKVHCIWSKMTKLKFLSPEKKLMLLRYVTRHTRVKVNVQAAIAVQWLQSTYTGYYKCVAHSCYAAYNVIQAYTTHC